MFKQLKKRLLSINMVSITLLMIIAFGSIYFVTYSRTYMEINNDLNHFENFKPEDDKPPRSPELSMKENILPEREVIFVVNLDTDSIIFSTHSSFDAEDAFYEEAVALVQSGENDSYIELDDAKWAYRVVPRKDFYQIFFVDVTSQLNAVSILAYTFLVVFLIMFVMTYIFSNYMTNESIKPIKKAFDKQNQFISDASHELKTPLAIINSNVDVLLNDSSDSEKWLHYIKSEVSRMSKLTENLLYLSQFDDNNLMTSTTDVNFSELCEHVLLGMEAVAFEKRRTLEYTIEPDIIIQGDFEQLSQVLMILMDNAMKYSNENGHISVNLFMSSQVNLTVTNDGPGIPGENIDLIFNRFYKVDASRSQKNGYGLGLAIAASIISHHHGKISCKSTINKETSFFIKLPK
ncbi:MAG: HAMP domain-containing histidine kinase [Clostridiales bacterium]|nr:HAMP domain-containing histidine kinase [Clostridiales bacterium]